RKMYSPKLREPAGWYAARDFCCAGAACLPLRREEGEPNRPLSVGLDATDGCRKPPPAPDPCFGVVLCNEYRNFNVSRSNGTRTRGRSPAYGANSYGARRTWRQAAGRSAILSPGLGFAGGPGLGWSTASVNQYASSSPQPSSAGRAGCGLHSALSDGQTSRTWK